MKSNAFEKVTIETESTESGTKDACISPVYKAAAYIRLSRETSGSRERDTIGSQTDLVESFIRRQDDLELYETYVDDSVSGTTFSRPGFDRMLADMRGGRFQAIVVKDMSRIGRNYLEAGSLVEQVFPLYGIRLISITDGFDTGKGTDWLLMALTNLANTMYARDISNKINAAKACMYEKGIPVGKVPYGYRINHNAADSGYMVVDDEAADVVKRIFADFISGKGTTVISRDLNNEEIPSPLAYRHRKNGHPDKASRYRWTANSVQQILGNRTYTGRYIMGKTSQKVFQQKKRMAVPSNAWHIFENHHPPIVSDEDFRAAQDRKRKKAPPERHEPNLLAHKVFCGKCGAHMGIPDSSAKNPKYMCRTNWYYGSGCGMGYVRKTDVYEAVMKEIQDSTTAHSFKDSDNDPFRKFKGQNELSQEMASELVAKVIVHDASRIEVVLYADEEAQI